MSWPTPSPLRIDDGDLGQIMPFYVALSETGEILAAGPTLRKMAPDLLGSPFLERFKIRRPANIDTFDTFTLHAGQKLQLTLRATQPTDLRGIACRLQGGGDYC